MKAVLCEAYGPPETLVVADVPARRPGPGEVVLAVHAASVNFPDTLIIENRYQFKPPLPFAPGGEAAGVVTAVGEGVQRVAVGDRVVTLCAWGAFADELVVPERRLMPLPSGIPMDVAACLVLAYGTTHYALVDRARLQPGETLLVLGAAGGTGLSAVELGKQLGARVIAAASSAEKLELCRAQGADDTIDYRQEPLRDRLKALTGGRGVDVVYDPVGGELTEAALRGLAWGGRHLVIGFTSGDIPRPPLNLALLKGASIVGVFYGAFTEQEPARCQALMDELFGWVASGRVRPVITRHLPLEAAAQALREVADRRVRGKIVLTTAAGRAAGLPG